MRLSTGVEIFKGLRLLLGSGLDFERQKFAMLLTGPGYVFSQFQEDLAEITNEAEGPGYKRSMVKFSWQQEPVSPEAILHFDSIVFGCRGSSYQINRWVIYRTTDSKLLFSGSIGQIGGILLTEGDDITITSGTNGIMRIH